MSDRNSKLNSRRDFVGLVGALGAGAALSGCAPPSVISRSPAAPLPPAAPEWDLSWIPNVSSAPSRAVFDATSLAGGFVLDTAVRFLDNFDTVFKQHPGQGRAVLMLRVRAVSMALGDSAWSRYPIGEDTDTKEGDTQKPARRNPFQNAVRAGTIYAKSTLEQLHARGTTILVCDFALGHFAERIATKVGQPSAEVHAAFRQSFVPGAYSVPSGMLGLALAQNAGCAFIPAAG